MKRKIAAWVQWFQPYSLCPRLQNLARLAIVGQLLPNRVKTIYNCKTHLVTRDPPRLCSSADYYSAFVHTVAVCYTVCYTVFNTGWRKILWFSAGKLRFIQKTCGINTMLSIFQQCFNDGIFFPLNNNLVSGFIFFSLSRKSRGWFKTFEYIAIGYLLGWIYVK